MNEEAQSTEVFKGRLITVRLQPVMHADGRVTRYEIVDHPDAVAIVAVRENTDSAEPLVALVRQPRPAIGKDTWEIPAGLIDPDEREHPERTAARELTEETGYVAGKLLLLNRHYPSPGFMNEVITIYLATQLEEAPGQPAPDPSEISQLEWKPLTDAMRMCLDGKIEDGKTIIGLWLARDMLARS